MNDTTGWQWLGGKYPPADGVGMPTHLKKQLQDLQVLGKEDDVVTLTTPLSLQVITAGATTLAKRWSMITAALGGLGASLGASKAFGWFGLQDATGAQQHVLTASAAALGIAAIAAVALIVRGDVMARATASAAEYRARAQIATALISSFRYNPPGTTRALARIRNGAGFEYVPIKNFTWDEPSGRVIAHLCNPNGVASVPAADIEGMIDVAMWNQEPAVP